MNASFKSKKIVKKTQKEKTESTCNRVITIPQYSGTCWFNAVLMSTLISENTRNLLYNICKHRKPYGMTNELYNTISEILQRRFKTTYEIRDYAYSFFQVITPEVILKQLNAFDKQLFNFDPDQRSGYFNTLYLPKFLNFLGAKDILMFDNIKNDLYLSSINTGLKIVTVTNEMYQRKYQQRHITKKDLLPEYDIILIYDLDFLKDPYKPNLYQKNFKYEETITFNNKVYQLDSFLLTNFNIRTCGKGHDICGVTCEGDRYMYNGWIRSTIDTSMLGARRQGNIPCELMKYDWLKNDEDFCLNPILCNLKTKSLPSDDLCFNAKKGDRVYIYVNIERSKRNTPITKSPVVKSTDLEEEMELIKPKKRVPRQKKDPSEPKKVGRKKIDDVPVEPSDPSDPTEPKKKIIRKKVDTKDEKKQSAPIDPIEPKKKIIRKKVDTKDEPSEPTEPKKKITRKKVDTKDEKKQSVPIDPTEPKKKIIRKKVDTKDEKKQSAPSEPKKKIIRKKN